MSAVADLLLPALLGASWKTSLLVGAAALATRAMRRSPASLRHLAWTLALAGALLLPLLSAAVPALPVLPRVVDAAPRVSLVVAADPLRSPASAASAAPAPPEAGSAAAPAELRVEWGRWLPRLWMLGALVVLLRLLTGVAGVWWLGRRAEMLTDGGWLHLAHDLARRLGLSRGVTLLHGDRGSVPMTWGVLQPIIWLPAQALEWSAERRTVVLAHELAHVRRRDALTQWIGHLALVVHWFNPLVWYAVRRLREERERACDDAVLEIGTLPTDYADHLLELVRSLGERGGPVAAMAMARRTQFEGRLLAILDGASRRGGIGRGTAALALACGVAAVLPLASLRAGEPRSAPPLVAREGAPAASTPAAESALSTLARASAARPGAVPAPDTLPGAAPAQDPFSVVALIRELESDGEKAGLLLRVLQLPDPTAASLREVVRAARTIDSSGDRSSVLHAVLQRPDPSAALLTEVLAAAGGMESDGDLSSLLIRVAPRLPVEDRAVSAALFSALAEIGSPGDRAAVLHRLVDRSLPDAALARAIRAAGELESDGDAAAVLAKIARVHRPRVRGELHQAFLQAARGIESEGDRAAALSALLGAGEATSASRSAGASARAARGTWSGYTNEQVLSGSHDGRPSFDLTVSAHEVYLGDDLQVTGLAPAGHLSVRHTRHPGNPDPDPLVGSGYAGTLTRHLEVRPGADGASFEYTVNGERRDFGPEGRAWLAGVLRHIHRR